jgi:transcriptional regulator with XRE-family HTH domain
MATALQIDAARLRRARLERALSQTELAERAQLHYVTLARIETSVQNAQPRTIRRLAEALGLQPTDIAAVVER